jgi:hypothetical protein
MGRREGIGSIAVGEQTDFLEHVTGAHPPHPVLKPVAGKNVGEGQQDPDKKYEDDPRLPLLPEDPQGQYQQNEDKIIKIGHEWHEPVEKRILAPAIDEVKDENVRHSQK